MFLLFDLRNRMNMCTQCAALSLQEGTHMPIDINTQREQTSAIVLANAAALVSAVVQEIAGNDISNSINGNKASGAIIETLVHQRIAKNLGGK